MHDQHSLTQLDQKKDTHANSCECPTITQTHVSSDASSHDSSILFLQAGLMSVGHLSLTLSSELVFEPQLDQKTISTPSFLHCRAQVDLEDHSF